MFSKVVRTTAPLLRTRSKPVVTYAIGDIHGELEKLTRLHDKITTHHAHSYSDHHLRLIHLGDYVDRGPDSAGVLFRLMELSKREDMEVINLAGNHEDMMVNALSASHGQPFDNWIEHGGDATLASYHAGNHYGVIHSHVDWLKTLPRIYVDRPMRSVFVHAGLMPDQFPEAVDEICMWTRSSKFLNVANWKGTQLEGWTVVHGHSPTPDAVPDIAYGPGTRINVDTGAVFDGQLSCAVMTSTGLQGFLSV